MSQKHLKKESNLSDEELEKFNYEVSLLASAKKTRLSFEELNLFSLDDFFDYLDMFTGENESDTAPRQATQEDIDNFYRYM